MSEDKQPHTETSVVDQAFARADPYGTVAEPTYSGALSLFRRRYTKDLKGFDVAAFGVPYDLATTNRSGARLGPRGVRQASVNFSWARPYGWDYDPFDRIAVADYGDLLFDWGRPGGIPDEITRQVTAVLDQGCATLAMGGDHFITYPILRAHAAKHGAPLSLIHFDAHSDTWRDEDGRIDHGTMFFHAAQQGIVAPERSIQVGLRTHNDETHGFNIIDAPWVHENGVEASVSRIKEVVGDNLCYLTFDIDCLDPSFAPGTGTPVPGGLTTQQAAAILKGLCGVKLCGMDLVEVAPAYDVSEITALAAADLIQNMLGLYAYNFPAR
ncbi:MAG: agmatinase [Rhodospirillales bacterium]